MRGFAHILVILITLTGLASGIYLVQQKTHLFSQATSKGSTTEKVSNTIDDTGKFTSDPSSQQNTKNPFISIFDRLKARGTITQSQSIPTSLAVQIPPTPSPTPIKTGNIKGQIVGGYYSAPLSWASVKASGQGIEKTTTTDTSGNFIITGLPIGSYNLSFSHPDYNISNWNNVEIKEGDNNLPRNPNGFLKIFKPTTVKGTVFVDHNGNGQKNGEDEGLDGVIIIQNRIGDSDWGNYKFISVDKSGNFSIDIPEGSIFKITPGEHTFYNKPNPTAEFIVDGYGGTKEFSFPYYPTVSQAGMDIIVFNDKNENGIQDADEENIDYYYAEVTNTSTGKSYKTGVSAIPGGGKGEQIMDYGTYNIKLIPGDTSWAYYYKITKGEASIAITNSSGKQTVQLGAHKLY